MQWRLIKQQAYSAPMNMAIDHAIYESVANGREQPTIRFYKWQNNSVSIGAYQNPKDINFDACKKHSIDVVRRMTGGRAVFHDKRDFTYSVIAPIRVFGYSIKNAYTEICQCIIKTLSDFGIKSSLENKNDIIVDGKKISGNASKAMDKGVYLQHGTLIYDINYEAMPIVLNVSEELVREKVTSLLQDRKVDQQKAYDTLKNNFTEGKEVKIGELSKYEIMRAEDLAKAKYNTITPTAGTLVKDKGACYIERGG